jgi:hypothetical protein
MVVEVAHRRPTTRDKSKPSASISLNETDISVPVVVVGLEPFAVRADVAAQCVGATTFHIEEAMREGKLPFTWMGKRKVIFICDLKAWAFMEREKQLRQRDAAPCLVAGGG